MHISHIQGTFSSEHGGPTLSLANYCRCQVAGGHRVTVWALEGFANTSPAVRLEPPVEMRVFRVDSPPRLGRSAAMRRELSAAESPDVYHLHGAWLRAMYYGATEARRRSRPYVLELMGMYEPWGLRQKWLQKRIARWWFQDAVLRHASCLHVNSSQEAEHIRALGFKAPVAVIPVGVDMEAVGRLQKEHAQSCPWPALDGKLFVLYLARIHCKKGMELLLEAWAQLSSLYPQHRVLVAGTGEQDYVQACREKARTLGIESAVVWAGHVSEAQRCWAYTNAECYVLPTYSENFGNTVAEALAHGTPALTTTGTPWLELTREGCGWVASPTVPSLVQNLREALALTSSERRAMGDAGRKLVERRYSLDHVIRTLDGLYEWVLGGGPKPECVIS